MPVLIEDVLIVQAIICQKEEVDRSEIVSLLNVLQIIIAIERIVLLSEQHLNLKFYFLEVSIDQISNEGPYISNQTLLFVGIGIINIEGKQIAILVFFEA